MNTRALQHFLKIVELQSFSKAAIVLGVSQPMLSRAVRDLEADLRVSLLYRDGRGVRPTEQGERFAKWAGTIVEQVELARTDLDSMAQNRLRGAAIGMLPTLTRLLTVPLITKLRQLYPDAQLRVVEGSSGHLMEWLTDGRLDLALLYDSPAVRRFSPDAVLKRNLHLIGSRSLGTLPDVIPFVELRGRPLILTSRTHGNRRDLETLAQREGMKLDVLIETDSLASLLQLVHAGHGWSILPAFTIADELRQGSLQHALIVEPTIERVVVLATPINRPPMAGGAALSRAVKSEIRRVGAMYDADAMP